MQQDTLEDLLKCRTISSTSKVPDEVGLVWGLRIRISGKFPGNANVVGLGPHCVNHCHR